MKSKGKLLTMVLCLILGVCCVLGFASCKKKGCKTHTYGEWEETKSATCTETGLKSRKCTVCGQTEVSAIRAIGHDWIPATCTSPKMCKNCFETEGTTIAHTYDREVANEKTLKTAATCTTKAVYYKSCVCGAISDKSTFEYGDTAAHTFDKEVVSEETLKSAATCTAKATYYKTCSVCGAVSDKDTFEVGETLAHTYDKEVVKPEALKSAATCTAKAVYYKSCVCGDISDKDTDTFEYGEPNGHTFDKEVASEKTLKSAATCTDKAVYYKTCSVCGAVSDKDTDTFENGEALGHDLPDTWTKGEGNKHVKECRRDGCTYSEEGDCTGGTPTCTEKATCSVCGGKYGDTDSDNHNYEWKSNGDGTHTEVCTRDESHKGETANCSGGTATCVEKATCEVCGEKYGDVDKTNHKFDRDVIKDEALKTAATCTTEAVYYKSCVCGEISKDDGQTFLGNKIPHTYNKKTISEEAKISVATCTAKAKYHLSCECGAVSDNENDTFEDGDTAEHNFTVENTEAERALKSAATCTDKATYYKSCSVCGTISNKEADTFESGETIAHTYTSENAKPEALKSAATCTAKAVYYKSCSVCGAISDKEADTFESGAELGHEYIETTTPATCTSPAVKTTTCKRCDYRKEENVGSALNHDTKGVTATEELVSGCEYVMVRECNRCHEPVKGETVSHHSYKATITTYPTCKATGEKTLTCETCGDTKVETVEIDTNGHKWVKGEVAEGSSTRTDTCSVCNVTKTVTVYDGNATGATSADDLRDTDVELKDASLSLDDGVIDTIGDTNITISAEKYTGEEAGLTPEQLEQVKDSPVYNFTINDGAIYNFGENNFVTITLPYTLAEGEDVDSIAIWYIGETGLESIKATYNVDASGNGYVTFKTNHFSYYTVTRLTPAERCALYGHSYSTQHVRGGCTDDSYDLLVCVRCHDKKIENYKKAEGHKYTTDRKEATCTENGYELHTCTVCNYNYKTTLNATGHKWTLVESVDSTCTVNGYDKHRCDNCNEEYTENYGKADHDCTAKVVNPTCEEEGYTLYECKNCDYNYKNNYVAALKHAYKATEWKWADDFTSATLTLVCGNDDSHVLILDANIGTTVVRSVCSDYVKTTYTAAVSHNGIIYSDKREKEEGSVTHAFSTDWKSDGTKHWRECVCGEKTDIADHSYDDITVTKEATCVKSGEKVATCVCGKTKKTVIPATGEHKYVNGVCETCGKSESSCDHKTLHKVTVNFADYGACGGYLYYETCECGEVKTFDATSGLDMDCNFTKMENEQGEPYTDEDGNMCMQMTSRCPACGFKAVAFAKEAVDGCEDIILAWYTLSVNDEVIVENLVAEMGSMGEHHDLEEVEIRLADYGACGGVIKVEKCKVCGYINDFDMTNVNEKCDIDLETEPKAETVKDENGIIHTIQRAACSKCGLLVEGDAWSVNESECVKHDYQAIRIIKGDVIVFEYVHENTEENHNIDTTYKKYGESCEDGVKITNRCSVCGYTEITYTSQHKESDFKLDLSEFGVCNGTIDGRRCEICEKVTYVRDVKHDCTFNNPVTKTTEDGHTITEVVCPTCGLKQNQEMWTVAESECVTHYYGVLRYYKGDEIIFECTMKQTQTKHKYEYEYEKFGETCSDGYKVKAHCSICGDTYEQTSYGHQYEQVEIDLKEEYDGCEGFISYDYCPVCGTILNVNNIRTSCQVEWEGEDKEAVIDGVTHYISTGACSVCGLKYVRETWEIVESDCVRKQYTKTSIFKGEELIAELTDDYTRTSHEFTYEYELLGETCEDGIEVTEHCTVCDFRNIYTSWGHVGRERKIDLGKLGLCGGYIYEHYCLACGEIMDRGESEECSWVHVEQTENGELCRCERCQAEKLVLETIGDKDENCNYVRTVSTVYYKDGKEVYRFERSYRETSHNYELSFELQGESCTDGYTVTYTCQDCHDTRTETRNTHDTYYAFRIDGSNTACGKYHDVMFSECPCGLEYSYSVGEGFVFDEESGTYKCDACGITIKYSTDRVETDCSVTETFTFEAKYGETRFDRTKTKTYANHEFKTEEVKTVDGVVSIVSTCEKCNATRETTSMSGTPEYHDDEGYYFEYRVTPETSAEYTIFGLSDKDTYVTLYRENNGNLDKLGSDDDGFGNGQFLLTTNLEAGKTYVYRIKYYSSSDNRDPIFFAFSAGRDNSVCRHEKSEKFSHLPDGATSCEDGVRVGYVCVQCGAVRSIKTITSHETDVITHIELGNYGACRGYIKEYSCPCGKEHGFDIYDICGSYTQNKYYDDDGKLITVEANACETCGLRYEKRYYSVRNAENCTLTYYYTVLVNVGTTVVYNTKYTTTETSHDYEVTYTLKNGEGSTCLDGVIVYKKCKDCGEEDNREINYHETYEVERIDLTEYGSTCRGYAVFYNCACGMDGSISLDNALCEFDAKTTPIWIENTVRGWYNIDASNQRLFSEYSYIMVCTVTDPTACGLKIRYAEYWLKDPNACVAYQYGTWQFGYNEQDGTYIREITFRMRDVETCHNYKDVSEDDNHQRFKCEDCGSYYYINREYGEDGKLISIESYSYNGVTTESRKETCRYSYYDDSQYESYKRNEYGKAGVVESWNEKETKYEDYTGPFGDSGRKEVEKYVYSNGDSRSTENAYVRYEGYTYTIYSYVTEGDYWNKYNYSYTFDPCQKTTSYTNSNGESWTETSDNCHFSYTVSKYPTCTQAGENYYKCNVCGKNGESYTVEANDHEWHYVESGNYYYCTRCGLENEKGASGSIVMEDLTAKYGNGENYVVGYYARNNVQFTTYVSLVFAGEERDIMVPDIEFITIDGIRAYAFSKAKVAEWATTNGYTDYNVRFSFVPVGGDGSFDYAITFTDEPEISVITEAATVKAYVPVGEKKVYTITVSEDAYMNITFYAGYSYNFYFIGDGKEMSSWGTDYSYSLKAGETYTLEIRPMEPNYDCYFVVNFTFEYQSAE